MKKSLDIGKVCNYKGEIRKMQVLEKMLARVLHERVFVLTLTSYWFEIQHVANQKTQLDLRASEPDASFVLLADQGNFLCSCHLILWTFLLQRLKLCTIITRANKLMLRTVSFFFSILFSVFSYEILTDKIATQRKYYAWVPWVEDHYSANKRSNNIFNCNYKINYSNIYEV